MSIKIAQLPVTAEFGQKTIFDLDELLLRQERSSSLISVQSPAEILFNDKGKIQDSNYRYVTTALAEAARAACPGLWKVVNDLAVIFVDVPAADDQVRAAMKAFNAVVSARFSERLYGRTVVANEDLGIYDGLLGPSYQYLPNLNLFEMLRQVADGLGLELQSAAMVGRRLRWIFCWPTPLVKLDYEGILEQYRAGFMVTNDETGEAAVRGHKIWFHLNEGLVCPRQEGSERLVHMGQSFDRKLTSLLRRLAVGPDRYDYLNFERCLKKLAKTSLKISSYDIEGRGERGKQIVSFLTRCGTTNTLAAQVLQTTARRGIENTQKQGPATMLAGRLARRKVYDLFVCLMREAQKLSIFQREGVERAAFNIIQSYGYVCK